MGMINNSNFKLIKADVLKFLRKIFADNDIYEYILMTLSFWTGWAQNKQEATENQHDVIYYLQFWGGYFLNGHPSIVTGKIEKAQCPNPGVHVLKGKCLVVFQKIETGDDNTFAKVNMAKLKSCSGNDISITARTLYKTQVEFKLTFQIVICMNKLPTLSTVDGGTCRRVQNIPFEKQVCWWCQ